MWPVSNRFIQELQKPIHTLSAKLEILNTDFKIIHTINQTGDPEKGTLIDGTVDADASRGARRAVTLSLLNDNGIFTPSDEIFDSTTEYGGYFYVNRMFRLWRGVRYEDGKEELVPVGTFMVDKAETLVERGISSVVITGTDLWKKLHKSQFHVPHTYTKNQPLNTVLKHLATNAGVLRTKLDPLSHRTTDENRLNTSLEYEPGDTRGDALLKIAEAYGIQVYFDPMGTLVSQDFREPFRKASVWTFDQSDSLIYYLRTVVDDSDLYNHVVVVGTGATKNDPPGPIYQSQMFDNISGSPTNINRIGSRVYRYESGVLATQQAVDKAAVKIFYDHFIVSRSLNLETICLPHIEGNDVLTVTEPQFARLDNRRYLITSFNIPLTTSKQKIGMKEVFNVAPST